LPYYELVASRLRFLGGTTNHWAGISRPLDELDFQKRDAVPHSGWPIERASLDPYYERAHDYCRLSPCNYDPSRWSTTDAPLLPLQGGRLETRIKLERPLRFGIEYRQQLERAQNVRVFLFANVTEIEAGDDGNDIRGVRARSLGGNELSVTARAFVIAAGAIENARLLLNSRKVHPDGIGNDRGLVGRFFMEHPLIPAMELQLASEKTRLGLYTGQTRNGMGVTGYLALQSAAIREEGLLNASASLDIGSADQRIAKSLQGVASAVTIWNHLKEGRAPPTFGKHVANLLRDMNRVAIYSYERAFLRSPLAASLVLELEQAPNPSSRVTLTDERDALGMQRANLHWQMGELERMTVMRTSEIMGLEMGRAEIGRIRVLEAGDSGWWPGMRGAWHQMGTTRMHARPAEGVVDADCRVHGIRNLYLAGGSVFTTSGSANPTLTIVALALRLADHLKEQGI
ncbi:MAG: GMC family oxidoreductase, partial [Woeseia sp.]